MKKILIILLVLLTLVGCKEKRTVNEILGDEFKEFVNNHLNEEPVSLTYFDGEEEFKTDNPEIVKAVYNAISSMKVGNRHNYAVNSNDKVYTFKYKNGDELKFVIISFAGEDFIFNPLDYNLYSIEDDSGLFDIELK